MKLSKEDFMALASVKYDLLETELDSNKIDFYEYEMRLEQIMLEFSRQILEQSLSTTEVSVHKKKSPNPFR